MKKNVYIFTAQGLSPGLYINIITHLFREYGKDDIEDITLLKIAYPSNLKKELNDELRTIRENISTQVRHLIKNQVRGWNRKNDSWDDTVEAIKANDECANLYRQVSEWLEENEIIARVTKSDQLDEYLENQTSNRNYEFVFDLTGAPKKDFVTIALALLSQKSQLHIFEVLKDFKFFKHQLIHEYIVDQKEDLYEYHNLNLPKYLVTKNFIGLNQFQEKWKKKISSGLSIVKIIGIIMNDLPEALSADKALEFREELILIQRDANETHNKEREGLMTRQEANVETKRLLRNLKNMIDML